MNISGRERYNWIMIDWHRLQVFTPSLRCADAEVLGLDRSALPPEVIRLRGNVVNGAYEEMVFELVSSSWGLGESVVKWHSAKYTCRDFILHVFN